MITAVAGGAVVLIGAIIAGVVALRKNAAEVERVRVETLAILSRIDHELKPNHGSSTRDVVDRVEGAGQQNAAALTTLQNSIDRLASQQAVMAADVGGIRQDIRHLAETDRLLAETDREDRERDQREHQSLWDAIKERIQGGTT